MSRWIEVEDSEYKFLTEYDPERERSANRRDLILVIHEMQEVIRENTWYQIERGRD